LTFNRDDWDGPIPPEHHPMLSPEVRKLLMEEKQRRLIAVGREKEIARRRRVSGLWFLLALAIVGALAHYGLSY
jgi:hypothetical protein